MKKAMYEQPMLEMLCFKEEDVIRTSNNLISASGDATFSGYTADVWN